MKYYSIYIQPGNKEWYLHCYLDPAERIMGDRGPHSMGFYHCPETKGAERGFEELKDFLISKHKKEIENIQKSLESLREVKFPGVSV